jgi:hypothetical protein
MKALFVVLIAVTLAGDQLKPADIAKRTDRRF